eukprot:8904058-Lingulodinium_polyedra.AAC.1
MAWSSLQPLRKVISYSSSLGCSPMYAMRQPRTTASAKTRVAPLVPQRQRRPQQVTCHSPDVWGPPYTLESEARVKSHARTGNSWH